MSIKKYKRGHELLYTATGNNTPLRCKVLCNQLEPGGGNYETALITIKAEKMAHPISIPVQDQDDYLREIDEFDEADTVRKPKKWFWVFAALLFFIPAANAQNEVIQFDSTITIHSESVEYQITGSQPIVFSPRIKSEYRAAQQEPEKTKFKVSSAILPLATGIGAGACADTEAGKAGRDAFLYGAAVSISFGRKKPFVHYLINSGVSFAGFFIGRGIREVSE